MVLCSPVMVNGELEQGLEQAPPLDPDYQIVGVQYLPVPHQPIIMAHVQSDHYNWEMS